MRYVKMSRDIPQGLDTLCIMEPALSNWIGLEKIEGDQIGGRFSRSFATRFIVFYYRLNAILHGKPCWGKEIHPGPNLRKILPPHLANRNDLDWTHVPQIISYYVLSASAVLLRPDAISVLYQNVHQFIMANPMTRKTADATPKEHHFKVAKEWLALGLTEFDPPEVYTPSKFWMYSKQTRSELLATGLVLHRLGIYRDARTLVFLALLGTR
jgi:hypothetical protein